MYEWVKALHVIADISWMAGILYLPRLMVYHCETAVGSAEYERFKVIERRLLYAIMEPASMVAVASGAWLAWQAGLGWSDTWFMVKLLMVVCMIGIQMLLHRHRKEFAAGKRERSARYFRILNEVPAVLMVVIVVMVIVRPF